MNKIKELEVKVEEYSALFNEIHSSHENHFAIQIHEKV